MSNASTVYAIARECRGKVKIISGHLHTADECAEVLTRKAEGAFIIRLTSPNPRKKSGKGLSYAMNSKAFEFVTSEFV